MLNTLLKDKKIQLLLGSSLLLIVILFVLIIRISRTPNVTPDNLPIPTPIIVSNKNSQEQKLSSLQESLINNEIPQDIESSPDFESKTTLPDGEIRYILKSPLISRKNEIIVKNGKVVFERILTPEKSNSPGYAKISDYTKIFGQPQEKIRGSDFYGPFISTLIYPNEGFALIGNAHTDEVYEIQTFQPMTLETYKKLYGKDINESKGPIL